MPNQKLWTKTPDLSNPPFKVGDKVITDYFTVNFDRKNVFTVTGISANSAASSGFLVTTTCKKLGPADASWYKLSPKSSVKKTSEIDFPKSLLDLYSKRLAAKKNYRKLRTTESVLELLSADSKLAAAFGRFLASK